MTSRPESRDTGRPVCVVTGATGAIGPGVVRELAATHDVRTFSRRPPERGLFGVPVTALTGEITDTEAITHAARGASLIVHLAALLHILEPAQSLRAEYERVNVHGTAAVMDAALAAGVSRVVVMSTIAVYGHQEKDLLDEESPTRPETPYGESKRAAEQVALAARRSDGTPLATVLRAAAVYGPRLKGNYQRLVRALARRRFVPVGPGDNRRTLVYEDDLAVATALAAVHDSAAGRIYNVSDGTPHPVREIIDAICQALDRAAPRWHAPLGPVRAAVAAASVIDGRLTAMLDKYLEDIAVDGSRIQDELGFRPSTGLHAGWIATVSEMRRTGLL